MFVREYDCSVFGGQVMLTSHSGLMMSYDTCGFCDDQPIEWHKSTHSVCGKYLCPSVEYKHIIHYT